MPKKAKLPEVGLFSTTEPEKPKTKVCKNCKHPEEDHAKGQRRYCNGPLCCCLGYEELA
jgi:hypothetical protein